MKSRGNVRCECCKMDIPTGHQMVKFAGRFWMIEHYRSYRDRRGGVSGTSAVGKLV